MKSRMPSPGLIIAVIALVLALGGAAIAAKKAPKNSVVSKSIKNGKVKTQDLRKHAVKAGKIARGAVRTGKLADGAVGGGKLAAGAVGSGKLAEGAVGTGKLANGAVTAAKADVGSLAGSFGSGILATEVTAPGVGGGLASIGDAAAIGSGDEFDLLLPVAAEARDIVGRADTAPPGDRTVQIRINKVGTGTVLSCTIPSGETTCSGAGPASFAAGDLLSVEAFVTATGASPAIGATTYQIGYRLAPGS